MKKIIFTLMLSLTILSGCAGITGSTATTQTAQVTYAQSCIMYAGAFNVALQKRQAGKLTANQIAQISLIDQQITPICTGPLPKDPVAATQQITAAVTTLSVLAATQ
jgi:uncharacterized protein YceK